MTTRLGKALSDRFEAQRKLQAMGQSIYGQIEKGTFPSVELLSRSIKNMKFDPSLRQFVLGDKIIRRTARNVRHLRPLTQLVWVAYFAHHLVNEKKTSTLRDIFYHSQAYDVPFSDQSESDDIITDLETIVGLPRERFHIFPEDRSAIFGDLTIEYTVPGYEGRRLNLTSHPDGMMIGPALTTAELIETTAEMVITVEKGAMFTRLVEEGAHKKFKALLVHTAGQAPRATRHLLRRLNSEFNLPIYVFSDGDPWGMHIAMVIISGSANAAHLRDLTTPDAKWAGVWATDITRYKLPGDKLNAKDIKRLNELKDDPRYSGELWQREIEHFLKIKLKAEQEAFSRYGLSFIVEKYLPEKLKEVNSM
jgi:DNA topoisomerase-6 subunit A